MRRTQHISCMMAVLAGCHALAQECPLMDGFEVHTSGPFCGTSYDLVDPIYGTTPSDLIDMCNQYCDCTGVTYFSQDNSGCLKDMARDAGDECSQPGCFYVRIADLNTACTTCVTIPNYTSHAGMDHWGSDINAGAPLQASALVVAAACTQTPGCVAFNTDGYLKNVSDNLQAAPGFCFYSRADPPATDTSNPSPVIPPASPPAPSPLDTTPVPQPPPPATSPVQSPDCPLMDGFEVHTSGPFCGSSYDLVDRISGTTPSDLIDMCNQYCDCTGVNYFSQDNSGSLKDMARAAGDECTAPGCFYVRIADRNTACTTCATILNYTSHVGMDHEGSDINAGAPLQASALMVATACTQTPGCVAFNSDGWLKNASDNLQAAPGECFYSRADPPATDISSPSPVIPAASPPASPHSNTSAIVNPSPNPPTSPSSAPPPFNSTSVPQPGLPITPPVQSPGDKSQNTASSKDNTMSPGEIAATVVGVMTVVLTAVGLVLAYKTNKLQDMRRWARGIRAKHGT